jgi:hypothetical protein
MKTWQVQHNNKGEFQVGRGMHPQAGTTHAM